MLNTLDTMISTASNKSYKTFNEYAASKNIDRLSLIIGKENEILDLGGDCYSSWEFSKDVNTWGQNIEFSINKALWNASNVDELATVLRNSKITNFILDYTKFSGAKELERILQNNTNIKTFSVSGINATDAIALANAINNSNINTIWLKPDELADGLKLFATQIVNSKVNEIYDFRGTRYTVSPHGYLIQNEIDTPKPILNAYNAKSNPITQPTLQHQAEIQGQTMPCRLF
ncbi:MAG: hypothetical protein JSS07_08270 [Proteobacteria bacterium]|nr:hypothetical protein [Pseudomonadota bacterium]